MTILLCQVHTSFAPQLDCMPTVDNRYKSIGTLQKGDLVLTFDYKKLSDGIRGACGSFMYHVLTKLGPGWIHESYIVGVVM